MKASESSLLVVFALVAGFVGGALANSLVPSGLVSAQDVPQKKKIMEAEEFRVVKNGKTRARLLADETGSYLALYLEKDERPRVALSAKAEGESLIEVASEDLYSKVVLRARKTFSSVYVARKLQSAMLTMTEGPRSGLEITNANERTRSYLGVGKDGAAFLKLYSKLGDVVWQAP